MNAPAAEPAAKNDPELVADFLTEGGENLDKAGQDLVRLEASPGEQALVDQVFRAIHSVKGGAGFLGFARIEALAHAGENLLNRVRTHEIALGTEVASALLATVDALKDYMSIVKEKASDADGADPAALVSRLEALAQGAPGPAPSEAAHAEAEPAKAKPEPAQKEAADTSIRVPVAQLDRLMDLVGELVLVRNQILQAGSPSAQSLNQITSELQERVMKARLQPISIVWGKLPRVVRDLALACCKKARVEMEGQDTELDKSLIEAIKDPMTHLIRNSVDHGIEAPEARVAAGKPEEGRVLLRARHESGSVTIEITDDGAGINLDRVTRKAIDLGLISEERASAMPVREQAQLIFHPGLSTASQVTKVSGRGVGMDVVKTNLERIGGSIDIATEKGLGTTFTVRIPLTLAIVPVLIVDDCGNTFALPQGNIDELIRLRGEAAQKRIERVNDAPVFRLRDKLLPLARLSSILGRGGFFESPIPESANIAVLAAGEARFGLVVERIRDSQEIVVKPLGSLLKEIPIYSGATILGDGTIALILDVAALALAARVGQTQRALGKGASEEKGEAASRDRRAFVLVRTADDGRAAIPLDSITRLERIDGAKIEGAGAQELVQYRGGIMPLLRLGRLLPERRQRRRAPEAEAEAEPQGGLHVLVCGVEGAWRGLVVERILDVAELELGPLGPPSRPGVRATFVASGKVTELLDLPALLSRVDSANSGAA